MSDTELERFTKMLKKMKARRARKVDIQGVEDRIKFLNKGKRNAKRTPQVNSKKG